MNNQDLIELNELNKESNGGTERRMTCTLKPDLLPHQENTIKPVHWNPDVKAVWDLENQGWRSFRYDSVIGFTTES